MLTCAFSSDDAKLYRLPEFGKTECFIATTPLTREICNNTSVAGVEYTDKLQQACAAVLKLLPVALNEKESVVVNILRGGLNFGLRNALQQAFGWNEHTTCFISAQRARNSSDSEEWHITENAYRKIYFPPVSSLIIGDVVATGTSLRYALNEMIEAAKKSNTRLRDVVFFTYGGRQAGEILEKLDEKCRAAFPEYRKTVLIYLEGCFDVPTPESRLTIRFTGTDLLRGGESVIAPDFLESQYENPAYPIERCTIYDAGSRAFWVREYAEDVRSYWLQVLNLAEKGVTFEQYLAERFPAADARKFGTVSLRELCLKRIDAMQKYLQ